MIQVNFKLTEDELYKSLVDVSKSRMITKILLIVGSILLAIMLYITTINIVKGIFYFSMGFIFPLFLGVYLIFLSEITAKFQVPNLIKKKNPFTERVTVQLDHTECRTKGETFSHRLTWEKFHAIVETDDFFLLKVTDVTANVLPKRAFTPEDILAFKGILASVKGPQLKLKKEAS
ncbi:hypothetical protein DYBT9275_02475 [Dyadobacter sp. CECT 9275]|uniref:YcxB-like C-terminal domain-containing protein n=1 Tax=Dyadobacter helix TaxID=2822344 RepID=A0A916JBD9_9BACT|nr:YcxB family protein [Dyadobacter sp. CECT 9275]CAG5000495.1 hypothetical protein DYBT9275_02475 [Dyadobacter sp. CECT 9275]